MYNSVNPVHFDFDLAWSIAMKLTPHSINWFQCSIHYRKPQCYNVAWFKLYFKFFALWWVFPLWCTWNTTAHRYTLQFCTILQFSWFRSMYNCTWNASVQNIPLYQVRMYSDHARNVFSQHLSKALYTLEKLSLTSGTNCQSISAFATSIDLDVKLCGHENSWKAMMNLNLGQGWLWKKTENTAISLKLVLPGRFLINWNQSSPRCRCLL